MADFPFTNWRYGFKFVPRSGIALNESASGVEDVRNMYGSRRVGTYVGIPMNDDGGFLTAVQLASLISHYEGDYANEFNFVDPETSDTVTVIYGEPGVGQPVKVGPDAYSVTVNLERHKQVTSPGNIELETGGTLDDESNNPLELEIS